MMARLCEVFGYTMEEAMNADVNLAQRIMSMRHYVELLQRANDAPKTMKGADWRFLDWMEGR